MAGGRGHRPGRLHARDHQGLHGLRARVRVLTERAQGAAVTSSAAAPSSFPMTSTERPAVRVAVIGSGPAGFYACEELLKQDGFAVDLYDALPPPFGLVRA